MKRVYGGLLLASLCLLLSACEEDLPTWGLPHGEAETLRFGTTLTDLQSDPSRMAVYVADWSRNQLHIIDTRTDTIRRSIEVGSKPINIEMDPASNRVYVALEGADAVAVVDPDAGVVEKWIEVPYEPAYLAVAGDDRLFVGPLDPSDGYTLAVEISTGQIMYEIVGGGFSSRPVGELVVAGDDVLVVARSQYLYSYDISDRMNPVELHVVEIDDSDLVGRRMETSPDGSLVYVTGRSVTTYVEVFRVSDLVRVGELNTRQPAVNLCVSPDGSRAFVASMTAASAQMASAATFITGFDTRSFTRRSDHLALGSMTTTSLAMSEDGDKLYAIVLNPYRIVDNPRGEIRQDVQILTVR